MTFCWPAVDRVLLNTNKIRRDYSMSVQRHVDVPRHDASDSDDDDVIHREIVKTLPIELLEVANVHELVTPEELIRFFENEAVSGGGRVLHAIYRHHAYLLTFKDHQGQPVC